MFGCQNKARGNFVELLVSAARIKRILFIAQYSFFFSCLRSTRLIFTVWLPTNNPSPSINFTFCWGNSPFKASYGNVTNPELFFALEEGPYICLCLKTQPAEAFGEQLLESPCKQQLRLPHLPRRLSPRTQPGFPLPRWCWFVPPMLSLHLCLRHVPWRSSTCTSGCVLVENKSTCSVIQSGRASARRLCCTGRLRGAEENNSSDAHASHHGRL